MPSPSASTVLSTPIGTLKILLNKFSDQLSNLTPSKTSISNPPNALALLHDSTSILRAQGTKLSLLLLNKPFTPSAIASILTSIASGCLPGLMSVYEICSADAYGRIMQNGVRNQMRDLVAAMRRLVDDVGRMAELADRDGFEAVESKREEILQVTGQVWSVCDRMLAIADAGIVGVAMDKAKEWEALVKDAISELEMWDPDADDDFDMDVDSDPEEESSKERVNGTIATSGAQMSGINRPGLNVALEDDEKDSPSTKQPPISDPSQNTDIHAAKAKVLKFLKLIKMLYPALRKRRISTHPPFTRLDATSSLPLLHQIKRFSDTLAFLEDFSTATDDLAGVLYDEAPDLVQAKMELMTTMAERCVDKVNKGWNGEADEFTEWSGKWVARVKEVGGGIPEELRLAQQYNSLSID
ncbi:MAG: hypothetical protein Q9169_003828 [Polycauliona sp. 2 TL-2023]